jgi:hypothetical protein
MHQCARTRTLCVCVCAGAVWWTVGRGGLGKGVEMQQVEEGRGEEASFGESKSSSAACLLASQRHPSEGESKKHMFACKPASSFRGLAV